MTAADLLAKTASGLPQLDWAGARAAPIRKGGSDRKYFRVRTAAGQSLIAVRYGARKAENRHYVAIAEFLSRLGVRVPRILRHDEAERLIWMEDLGERDLWSFRDRPWAELGPLYRDAIDEIVRLHATGHRAAAAISPALQGEFDADLYRWEQSYFFDHCAAGLFGWTGGDVAGAALEEMVVYLAARPRVLVHRDFQSQNILIAGGRAYLIDFQGLRPGLPQYDLASLLYDPYVGLSPERRRELLAYYCDRAAAAGAAPAADFGEVFARCAAQRLMQALGAYGFLGLVRGRREFLDHVQPALGLLGEVVGELPELAGFGAFLGGLRQPVGAAAARGG